MLRVFLVSLKNKTKASKINTGPKNSNPSSSASDKINGILADVERTSQSVKEKPAHKINKKRKDYHKALRQIFTAAGITGNPVKSEQAQQLMSIALTPRQKDIVTLVLKNKSLSDIARKLNISSPTVSVTFKTALGRLENPKSRNIKEVNVKAGIQMQDDKVVKPDASQGSKYTRYHYALRDVLIKQGIEGNPLLSTEFNKLLSSRLTAIQQDTVKQIIAGHSLDDIARDYKVGKPAVTFRLKQAIEKLSFRAVADYKKSAMSANMQSSDPCKNPDLNQLDV